MIRGNGANFGAALGTYYNSLAIFPSVPRVGGVSAISPNVNQDTTPTQDVPGTPIAGDIIFAHLMAAAPTANATFTPPVGEGWQSVASGHDLTQSDTRAQVFSKVWGAGDIDNVTVVFTSSHPNARLVLLIVRNGDTTTPPVGAAQVGSQQVGSSMPMAPTVLAPDRCLLMHFYEVSVAGGSVTADVNPIYGGPSYIGGPSGQDVSMAADATAVPSGSTAVFSATGSTTSVNGWTAISMAFEGDSSVPVVQSVSAISADVDSPSPTNTIMGTPAAGEIIVAHLVNGGSADDTNPAYTPPVGEGWQTDPAIRITSQTANDSSSQVFWKRWGAGFTDNTVVTFTGTTGNARLVLTRLSGCVPSGAPFASASASSDDASNDMGVTTPALAVPEDVSLVLRFYAATPEVVADMEINAPMNEAYDGAAYSFDDGNNGAMAGSFQVQAVAGTAALRSAQTSVKTTNGWVGITVAVGPVP
jgi:hypothetical protein